MQGLGSLIPGILKEDEVTRTPSPKEGWHCILRVAVMDAAWVLKVGRRTSGVHSGRDQPRPGISQRSTGAGCLGRKGIPRERRFHRRRASLRAPPPSQTPAACACGAELGGGRFPCVSAVTSARGVFSRGFPSRSPAGFNPSCAGVKAGKSELGICSSPVEGTGLAGPRGG